MLAAAAQPRELEQEEAPPGPQEVFAPLLLDMDGGPVLLPGEMFAPPATTPQVLQWGQRRATQVLHPRGQCVARLVGRQEQALEVDRVLVRATPAHAVRFTRH